MLYRLFGASAGAIVIAAVLIFLMHRLIEPDSAAGGGPIEPEVMRMTVVPKKPELMARSALAPLAPVPRTEDMRLPERPSVQARMKPPPPRVPEYRPTATSPETVSKAGIEDRAPVPVVKVQPTYPQEALEQGLEGHVLLSLTVTETGSVSDVIVIDSSHSLFASAAQSAVTGFRYEPESIDGAPIAVRDVRIRIDFLLVD